MEEQRNDPKVISNAGSNPASAIGASMKPTIDMNSQVLIEMLDLRGMFSFCCPLNYGHNKILRKSREGVCYWKGERAQ